MNTGAITADVGRAVNMMEFNILRSIKIPQGKKTHFLRVFFFFVFFVSICNAGREAAAAEPDSAHRDLKKELYSQVQNLPLVGDIAEGTLDHRRSARVPIRIDSPGCYVIAAVGENTVEDLSLAVLQSGVEKASDRLSKRKPLVKWCASTGGSVEAEVLMFKGRGAFVLGVFADRGGNSNENANASSHRGAFKVGGSDSDFIANRIRQLYPKFGKKLLPVTDVLRGNLAKGADMEFSFQTRGKCLLVIAAQESSLIKMDVSISSTSAPLPLKPAFSTGFFVAETAPCRDWGDSPVVSIRAIEGEGRFGLQIYSE